MLNRVLLCLFIASFLAASPSSQADEPIRVRVLTYNIHHGAGTDGRLDLERIARVIRSTSPDVVGLQEVDRGTQRSGGVDQAQELARLTGLSVVFGHNLDYQGGQYGNAVLTRWPVVTHRNHRLPSFDDGETRGLLEVELQLEGLAQPLRFFCTHLDHRRDDRERRASIEQINAHVVGLPESGSSPAVLAGDLNAEPDSAVLKLARQEWGMTSSVPLPTIPVEAPERQIDYVLVRPASRWRVVEIAVLPEAVASDHRALFAILELRRP